MVPQGSPCPIKLTATSIKDPTHQDGSKNSTFYVFTDLHKNVMFVDRELKTLYMFPDSEKGGLLEIRNVGNYIDSTISINVTTLPEDWEVIIDSSDIPAGGLRINASADIEVTVKTPKQVVESSYEIKISAMSNNEIKDEIILPVQILKVRKISLFCMKSKNKGNVSEKISYIVTVENNGNSKDSVDLRYSYVTRDMGDLDWKVELSKNFTTLYPYESRDVIVSVLIPLEALADTNYLTPGQEGYLIRIRGISQNDTTVTAEKEIEVQVNPIYDFSFSKTKDVKYIILHQAQIVDYTFKIENKGNIQDIIEIWPDSDAPGNLEWISIPYDQRKLFPGVTEELTINLYPPPHLDAGRYNFIINGESLNDPTLNQSLILTIEIIDSDLELSDIMIGDKHLSEANVKEGETVLIRALVTNVADLDYYNKSTEENVVIKFMEGSNYIGETNFSYLPSKRTSEKNSVWITHSWKIGKARPYTIVVKLDPYEAFPESRIENNELSDKVEVKSVGKEEKDSSEIESSQIFSIVGIIIIFIIIMIIGIWMNITLAKRGVKKGYTVDGEYKPYEETDKAEFEKDEEEEQEPEGGVVAVGSKHPYGKKTDKFMTDVLSLTTMKPIRKTKPIKKSKPITSLAGEGRQLAMERPHIAGLLPPKSDKASADTTDNTTSTDSNSIKEQNL
jgi:uncharacterized membrane protein